MPTPSRGVLLVARRVGVIWQASGLTCAHRPDNRRDGQVATYLAHDLSSHFFAMDGYDHPGSASISSASRWTGSPSSERSTGHPPWLQAFRWPPDLFAQSSDAGAGCKEKVHRFLSGTAGRLSKPYAGAGNARKKYFRGMNAAASEAATAAGMPCRGRTLIGLACAGCETARQPTVRQAQFQLSHPSLVEIVKSRRPAPGLLGYNCQYFARVSRHFSTAVPRQS